MGVGVEAFFFDELFVFGGESVCEVGLGEKSFMKAWCVGG